MTEIQPVTKPHDGMDYDGKTYCTTSYLVYLILKSKKRLVKYTGDSNEI